MVPVVVQAVKKNVFKCHLPAGLREKIIRGRENVGQSGLVVGRHDLGPQGVVGSVQGYGQVICLPRSASRRILVGSPTVEIVMCRAPMPRPSLAVAISSAPSK